MKISLTVSTLFCAVSVFAQVADLKPEALTAKNITGSYVLPNGNKITHISIKGNHSFTWRGPTHIHTAPSEKSKWEIRNDTLLIRSLSDNSIEKKMVMHNGSLHLVGADNKTSSAALMTKKDYKYYQRQCKKTGS